MTARPKMKPHCSTAVNSDYLSVFFFFWKQRSDSRLVISFVMHRLLRRGSLPVCPPPHAQWGGIRLHEAQGHLVTRNKWHLPEKIKNTNLIRPHAVSSHSGSGMEQVSV